MYIHFETLLHLFQAMVDEKQSLERENAQLQAGEASLRGQVTTLESSLEGLQQELGTELETLRS